MKLNNLSWFGVITLAALPLCSGYGQNPVAPASSSSRVAPAPNNSSGPPAANLRSNVAEVVKLSNAGVSSDIVQAFVNSSHSPYKLSANDILQRKNLGISQAVITAMLNHDSSLLTPNQSGQLNYKNSQPPPTADPAQTGQPAPQPEASVNT